MNVADRIHNACRIKHCDGNDQLERLRTSAHTKSNRLMNKTKRKYLPFHFRTSYQDL